MLREISRQFRTAALMFVVLSLLTGIVYPLLVSVIAEVFFPYRASGSRIRQGEQVVGSEWIGQPFDDERYFWSRPSATAPFPYNAAASSGSNLGPLNPALTDTVRKRIERLRAADPMQTADVPIDLVTASGSGLDPHISPAAAEYQVARVARTRKMSEDAVRQIVHAHIEGRQLGILGEPRVNVLRLNLALDQSAESE